MARGHGRDGHHGAGIPLRGERGDVGAATGRGAAVAQGELGLVALVGAVLGGVPAAALEPPVSEAAHGGRALPLARGETQGVGGAGDGGRVGGDRQLAGPAVVEGHAGGAFGHDEEPGLALEGDDDDRGAVRAGDVGVVGLEADPPLHGRDLPAEVVGEPAADPGVGLRHVEGTAFLAAAGAAQRDLLHEAHLVSGEPAAPLDQGAEAVGVGQVGDVGYLAGDIAQVRGGLRLADHVRGAGGQGGHRVAHDLRGGHVGAVLQVGPVHQPADGEHQGEGAAEPAQDDGRVAPAPGTARAPPEPPHGQPGRDAGRHGQQGQ